jgi:FlaA1/EpsC-like NDP-sugar epimerase
MVGADVIALPLLMVLAYAVRSGSLESAVRSLNWVMWAVPLLAVPLLGAAGLYRTVVRYIEVGVIAAAGVVLAVLCVLAYGLAVMASEAEAQRMALLVFWFMAFAYVVSSRLMARS